MVFFLANWGGGADLDLDFFGVLIADHKVVGFFHMVDDGFIKIIAGGADGFADGDVGQGDDGDLGGAAADIDDHAGLGFGDGEAGADARGHGFFDEIDFACAGALGVNRARRVFRRR